MSEENSYARAFEELQLIISQIEAGDTDLDELSEKVKRASFLIKICKGKLQSTEEDVKQILKELSEE